MAFNSLQGENTLSHLSFTTVVYETELYYLPFLEGGEAMLLAQVHKARGNLIIKTQNF